MQALVVDDSSTMRRILTKILDRLDFPNSVEAASGLEALKCLESAPVDLIIVDWNMPGMTGLEFVRAIRSTAATKDIPVIMVTGNAASDDIVRAVQVGIDGYIVKPFRIETLREKIAVIMGNRSQSAA